MTQLTGDAKKRRDREIRLAYLDGVLTVEAIAKQFGVSRRTVHRATEVLQAKREGKAA